MVLDQRKLISQHYSEKIIYHTNKSNYNVFAKVNDMWKDIEKEWNYNIEKFKRIQSGYLSMEDQAEDDYDVDEDYYNVDYDNYFNLYNSVESSSQNNVKQDDNVASFASLSQQSAGQVQHKKNVDIFVFDTPQFNPFQNRRHLKIIVRNSR